MGNFLFNDTPAYPVSILHRIPDPEIEGGYIEIGEDRDGLGLLELRAVLPSGKVEIRFALPPAMMRVVAKSVLKITEDLDG